MRCSHYQAKCSDAEKAFNAVRKELKQKANKDKKTADKAKGEEQLQNSMGSRSQSKSLQGYAYDLAVDSHRRFQEGHSIGEAVEEDELQLHGQDYEL